MRIVVLRPDAFKAGRRYVREIFLRCSSPSGRPRFSPSGLIAFAEVGWAARAPRMHSWSPRRFWRRLWYLERWDADGPAPAPRYAAGHAPVEAVRPVRPRPDVPGFPVPMVPS